MSEDEQATVSLPIMVIKEIDRLMDELGFWPSRKAFVVEATAQKIRFENIRLREREKVFARASELQDAMEEQ